MRVTFADTRQKSREIEKGGRVGPTCAAEHRVSALAHNCARRDRAAPLPFSPQSIPLEEILSIWRSRQDGLHRGGIGHRRPRYGMARAAVADRIVQRLDGARPGRAVGKGQALPQPRRASKLVRFGQKSGGAGARGVMARKAAQPAWA